MMKIYTPTLLIDKKKCLTNIEIMLAKAKENNLAFRPHFKTHQSHEIGRWFRDKGVSKIAVSSLQMASYFAKDNWTDITVAFPCNILEIDRIQNLAKKIKLNLLVESLETIRFLESNLLHNVSIYIKVDLGYGRTGISPDNTELLHELVRSISQAKNLNFIGFLGHSGNSYNCRGKDAIRAVYQEALNGIDKLNNHFKPLYPNLEISYGDTPTCSIIETFNGITELRPGNFVLYDLVQQQIGSCSYSQIAVAVACPIVAKHVDRNELVIYGGGVHFSKDVFNHQEYGKCYGLIVSLKENSWGDPISNVYLSKISQEHGIVHAPPSFINSYSIGDILYILPVHSCMTVDLLRKFVTFDGERIELMMK